MIPWNASPESADEEVFGTTLDRRRDVRAAPVGDGTALWVESDHLIRVEVVDESENGLGIVIPPDTSFELGPVVYIDYQGTRRAGAVAHLTRREDNSYRLGITWRSSRPVL